MGLKELVEISNFYGKNEEIVLAGGGNTSYKDTEYLYIKASGTTLATISVDGFVKMNRGKLAQMWSREYSPDTKLREAQVLEDLMNAREATELTKRPSVETMLHDLFSQSYVVHTHPAVVNGLTCSEESGDAAKRIFGDEVIYIPATMPGYVLSKAVEERINEYEEKTGKKANIVLLENHGLFVAGDSLDEIKMLMDDVLSAIGSAIIRQPDLSSVNMGVGANEIQKQLTDVMGKDAAIVLTFNNAEISRFIEDEDAFRAVGYAFTPDHMVYYKHTPLFVEQGKEIDKAVENYKAQYGFLPKAVAVQGMGMFACGTDEKQADIVRLLFIDTVKIAVYAKSFGGGRFMPDWLVEFINHWEVEQYRKSVSEK